jgi:hypothetical protein
MDRRLTGLLGAAAALMTLASADASPAQPTDSAPTSSDRNFLDPIPNNAIPLLKPDDGEVTERQTTGRDNILQARQLMTDTVL